MVAGAYGQAEGERVTFRVEPNEHGLRLDQALKQRLPLRSRAALQRAIVAGDVRIDPPGRPVEPSRRLRPGETVDVVLQAAEPHALGTWPVPVPVLLEDVSFVVVDKPAGWVVHPGAGHSGQTLVNALLHHYPEMGSAGGGSRPGIVHRLDKGTSGALVIARTQEAHLSLSSQFSSRAVRKTYLAIVRGCPTPRQGTIDAPIGRDRADRKRFSTRAPRGKPARTAYYVKERGVGFSLLEIKIGTGRTHQIRVHMTSIGHPLVGDRTYGRATAALPASLRPAAEARGGAFLHAWRLEFAHPRTGDPVRVTAPVPEDLRRLWEIIPKEAP